MEKINDQIVSAGLFRLILILSFLQLTLSKSNAQITHLGYIQDLSESVNEARIYDLKEAFKEMLAFADIQNEKAGIWLGTTTIGSSGLPQVNTATLPVVKERFPSAIDRRNNMSRFVGEGLDAFSRLDRPADEKQTAIYRSLCAFMDAVPVETPDRAVLVIHSDFISSSGALVSFATYKNNPAELMEAFDTILFDFREDREWPDLSLWEVHMIAPAPDSELGLIAIRWWEKAFYAFGAKSVHVFSKI